MYSASMNLISSRILVGQCTTSSITLVVYVLYLPDIIDLYNHTQLQDVKLIWKLFFSEVLDNYDVIDNYVTW